jgi:hypothetical protein
VPVCPVCCAGAVVQEVAQRAARQRRGAGRLRRNEAELRRQCRCRAHLRERQPRTCVASAQAGAHLVVPRPLCRVLAASLYPAVAGASTSQRRSVRPTNGRRSAGGASHERIRRRTGGRSPPPRPRAPPPARRTRAARPVRAHTQKHRRMRARARQHAQHLMQSTAAAATRPSRACAKATLPRLCVCAPPCLVVIGGAEEAAARDIVRDQACAHATAAAAAQGNGAVMAGAHASVLHA